jgi:subtilase family serine protease
MMKTSLATLLVPLALALAACGGSSGGGSSSASVPEGEFANPPYAIAPSDDLAIYMCHAHQDWYANPRNFAFYWSVRSTFATTIPSIDWKIERLDGAPQPAATGTITGIPGGNLGGDGHEHAFEWQEQAPGARHMYRLTINASGALSEASRQNNSYIFVVDVPDAATPSQTGDLEFYAREAHFHAMMPNSQYVFHFQARNRKASRVPTTTWRLQAPDLGIDRTYDLDPIDPDGIAETDQTIQILAPGLHAVTITLDSAGQVSESNEGNNSRTFWVLVGSPSGSG